MFDFPNPYEIVRTNTNDEDDINILTDNISGLNFSSEHLILNREIFNMYVGVDIVHIVRIKKNIKNFTFIEKIFTSKEIKYCNSYPKPEIHFSGKFAAKEAVKKALLSGKIVNNISMKEIQVLNNSDKSLFGRIQAIEIDRMTTNGYKTNKTVFESTLF